MSKDKIAEIRARHEAGAPGEMPIWALAQADADREFLLTEVERLRAVISTLEIVGKAADDERAQLRAQVERLRGDAQAIAAIAHTGGTAGLSEHEALVEIRRRTLKV